MLGSKIINYFTIWAHLYTKSQFAYRIIHSSPLPPPLSYVELKEVCVVYDFSTTLVKEIGVSYNLL